MPNTRERLRIRNLGVGPRCHCNVVLFYDSQNAPIVMRVRYFTEEERSRPARSLT